MSETTFADLIAARACDDGVALWFEGRSWTWREVVGESRVRAGLARTHATARAQRRPGDPTAGPATHVGVLCENTPEHLFWWLGLSLAGVTYVGINPTRRGPDLAHDIAFTDCGLLVVDETRRALLAGIDGLPPVLDVGAVTERTVTTGEEAPLPPVHAATTLSLVFTSGTTSAPKAVICSQARMARIARQQAERRALTADDTFYVVMPMFHSNALMAGIAPAVATGGTIVLRRRFSASAFLDDVRTYGVTFFNYVGKPLAFVLTTPERPDDADNPLRIAFGNEASERAIAEFSRRFGCEVIDSFGSSEGEIRIMRHPDAPPGSLGVAADGIVVLDPDTGLECPPALFDDDGVLLNADEATGEIVHLEGAGLFEGYYKNDAAEAARVRGSMVWSGDLAYRDADGFWFFAGRTSDWLRVDGENLAAAPIERLLARFPAFDQVAVVAVPDDEVGDQVLAVAELAPDGAFDPEEFARFLDAQPDLGTKWAPAFVRLVSSLPRTPTSKVVKRALDPTVTPGDPDLWRRETGPSGRRYVPA
jgi:fatty-acyl-CoA synthase